jgi:hypothetical protein
MISPTDAVAWRNAHAAQDGMVIMDVCGADRDSNDCVCFRLSRKHQRMSRTSPLYLVTAEMAEIAVSAGRSVPLTGVPGIAPSPVGFMIIDRPMGWNSDDDDKRSEDIVAVSWDQRDMQFCLLNPDGQWGHQGWTEWARLPEVPSDMQEDNTIEGLAALRPFIAASLLMQQKLAVAETGMVSRQVRRHAARRGLPSAVKVIRWRKVDRRQRSEDEQALVEWSHRWIVSGHWRNQWYPRFDAHLPIWIAPHQKGPKDKPLVVRETVTVWNR